MIPKIIHYCWFGRNPLPESAIKCIESWKKYMPDYAIKEWNEDNFNVNIIRYTAEAYKFKKYAFVSDYARFWILYHYGGVYFDVDVELIKPIDDIIAKGAFMGKEKSRHLNVSINPASGLGMGAPSKLAFYKKVLETYDKKHFATWNGNISETVVSIIKELLKDKPYETNSQGIIFCQGIYIYPDDYFCPLHYYTKELTITNNTRSIHHYVASWSNKKENIYHKILRKISYILTRIIITFTHDNK